MLSLPMQYMFYKNNRFEMHVTAKYTIQNRRI